MARIPLVSEFKPEGIDKAIREFQKLETTGQKVGMALEKSFLPAVAAVGALAAGAVLSATAAAEDAAAQQNLARQLRATTDATDAQIAAVNAYIAETELASTVSDTELRPAFENLVRATGDVTEAQDLMNLALDISAATGKDLQTVSEALQEAYQGEVGPLKELDRSLTDMIASGASADQVMSQLADTFGGAAQQNANTVTGRFQRMQIQMGNVQEQIGYALLPIIEKFLPVLEDLATFIGNNTELIIGIGVAVGTFATAIIAANLAMKAWTVISGITAAINAVLATSFTALWVATGIGIVIALIAVIVTLQMKFDILGKAVDFVKVAFDVLWYAAKIVMGGIVDGINTLIDAWNKLPLLPDIPKIEAGFLDMKDASDEVATGLTNVEATAMHAAYEMSEMRRFTGLSADMMNQALLPALESTKVAVNTAAWELAGFYGQLDRDDAFAKFSENLAEVQAELKGLEPGSAEFEASMREAYNAVRELSNTLGYIPATLEKTLLYRIEIGDIAGAERLAGLISASDTYRADPSSEMRFQTAGGFTGNSTTINVNMPAGANGQDVIDAVNREARRTGQAQVPIGSAVRR
jgi:hypothetical protein